MKKLDDYKEDIYKCSKCGLCQSVCPIYKVTKNEYILSRSKFTLLNGIIKKDLKLNKEIIKNLDICLNCNECQNFCPSNINAKEIFAAVKNEYNSSTHKVSLGSIEFLLKIAQPIILFYRALKLYLIIDKISSFLHKLGFIGEKILLFNSIIKIESKASKNKTPINSNKKIVFFEGCFNKYINPSSKNATINILQKMGYSAIIPKFNCCGISDYYNGKFNTFEKNALKIIKKIPKNIEYIICDCDSCISTLNKYTDLFNEAKFLKNKIISVNDFVQISKLNLKTISQENITYHKPCHNNLDNNILENIKEIKYVQTSNSCCGFGGTFGIKHNKLSTKIAKEKINSIAKKNIDIIITSCPSCKIGLLQGIIKNKQKIKVLSISEFIAKHC